MKMYEARVGRFYESTVRVVDVEKFNEKSVWVKGRRLARESEWKTFFEKREEAVNAVVERCRRAVEYAESNLAQAKACLEEACRL